MVAEYLSTKSGPVELDTIVKHTTLSTRQATKDVLLALMDEDRVSCGPVEFDYELRDSPEPENPYFEAFQSLQDNHGFRGQTWFGERQDLVERYSWAVPNKRVLQYMSSFQGPVYEIGAGNGYWANLLEQRGVDVTAVDQSPPAADTLQWTDVGEQYISQETSHSDFGQQLRDSVVLMVWPPYGRNMAYHVARCEPAHILYVGETRGGCTANSKFFDTIESKYGAVETIPIPSYEGIHDNCYHYVRKAP